MRPWRVRLAFRRSRVQWALLAVVLLVSTLSSTMLSSLFLLSTATERFAAREVLSTAPDELTQVSARIEPDGPVQDVAAGADAAGAEIFADIPFRTRAQIESTLVRVPRERAQPALAYLSYFDDVEDRVILGQGRWPEAGGDPVEVAVPLSMLRDAGMVVGDTVEAADINTTTGRVDLVIVGAFEIREPGGDFWSADRLQGNGHDPDMIVPFSGGLVTTDGYGPLLTTREDISNLSLGLYTATFLPDFSQAEVAQVAAAALRVSDAEATLRTSLGANADAITVITAAPGTLGGVVGSLAVTRSSVLVTGLLLLVLAIAALAQTARLMAERRHSEQHLMRARGASNRQLLRVGAIEALALGLLTTALGPPLALGAYSVISRQPALAEAGMNQSPGLPPLVWGVSAVVGLLLVAILVLPLLRRGGTFVDAEQARSRPSGRAAFQRGGVDLALVALAALAYWQLRSYESPVMAGDGVARVDPLLAAGPALALLAGALVCVRLIPASSRLLEGMASRGRKAVMPLAAWEVGRRSARAVSAILLLTLAVSVGAFSLSFLTTWRTSQDHQAQLSHPAQLEVAGLDLAPLAQAATLADERLGATATPLVNREAQVLSPDNTSNRGNSDQGRTVRLVAGTAEGFDSYTQGRLAPLGGTEIASLGETTDDPAAPGIALPAGSAGVRLTASLQGNETGVPGIGATLRLVVQDARGQYATVDLGLVPLEERPEEDEGEEDEVRTVQYQGFFADAATAARLSEPVSIVGVQTTWGQFSGGGGPVDFGEEPEQLRMELSIDDIAGLIPRQVLPVYGLDPLSDAVPVTVAPSLAWFGANDGGPVTSIDRDGDQIHVEMSVTPGTFLRRVIPVSLTAAPVAGDVPVVVSANLSNAANIEVGDALIVRADDARVRAVVVGVAPYVPGPYPRALTVVADLDALQLAVVQNGGPALEPTGWQVSVPASSATQYLSGLPEGAEATTQTGVAQALKDDPLRVGVQAAIWLVAAAAILLAAVGFGVHTVVTVRAREVEFAQLRAVGLQQRALTRLIGAEGALLSVLGLVFGIGLGVALGYLVAPLISVGPDGRPPLPTVVVDIPWAAVSLLVVEVAVVLAVVVLAVSALLRRIDPARMLRAGD